MQVVLFLFFRDSHNMCLTLYKNTVLNKNTTYIFREINSLKAMKTMNFYPCEGLAQSWHPLIP